MVNCPNCGHTFDVVSSSVDIVEDLHNRIVEEEEDLDDAVDNSLALLPKEVALHFRPAVRRIATTMMRNRVRGIERDRETIERDERRRNSVSNRGLATLITLRSGKKVLWGDATIEELEERKELLLQHRNGVEKSIAVVDASIEEIRSVPGATCLNEARGLRPIGASA